MASASHSLVIRNVPIRTATFSWTSAATSSGTKKIRRIVNELGRFIPNTNIMPRDAVVICANRPDVPARAGAARKRFRTAAYTDNSAMLLSRRHFFFGSLALPAIAAKKPAPERPNVLLLIADNVPQWVLGAYGNKEIRTPNLDRLSKMGTRFLDHYVASPSPAPSRASLLSGLAPMRPGPGIETVLGPAGDVCNSGTDA